MTSDSDCRDLLQAQYWITQLSQEMEQRLAEDAAENKRHASLLTLHFNFVGGHKSKAAHLVRHDAATMAATAMGHLHTWINGAPRGWAITGLSLAASNFHGAAAGSGNIKQLFARKQDAAATPQGQAGAALPSVAEQSAEAIDGDAPAPPTDMQHACPRLDSAAPHGSANVQACALDAPALAASAQHEPPAAPAMQAASQIATLNAIGTDFDDKAERRGAARAEAAPAAEPALDTGAHQGRFDAVRDQSRHSDGVERAARLQAADCRPAEGPSPLSDRGESAAAPMSGSVDDAHAPASTLAHVKRSADSVVDAGSEMLGHGTVDACTLAQLPPDLRAEVWASMFSGRAPASKAARSSGKVAAKGGQRGMGSFFVKSRK